MQAWHKLSSLFVRSFREEEKKFYDTDSGRFSHNNIRCHDIQHDDTQHNDTQHIDIQTFNITTLSIMTFSITTLSITVD
jgi:hypothetical protein